MKPLLLEASTLSEDTEKGASEQPVILLKEQQSYASRSSPIFKEQSLSMVDLI